MIMSQNNSPHTEDILLQGAKSYLSVSDDISAIVEAKTSRTRWLCMGMSLAFLAWGGYCMYLTLTEGIGVWGLNKTVGWAWDITNFVWWVGIGHAGTLISAVLLLFRQKWRLAINRSAEAMTIFAVLQASIFPIIHLGRPWKVFWNIPYPNTMGSLWVNLNSPLLWDVLAISTYLSVSLVFWWIGLLPDFAMLRDKVKSKYKQKLYALMSFGWVGTAKNWQRFEEVSLTLAGLATALVVSVHTIVSFDFATSVVPGWHTTIFPPYFVAGAIFSGFAMVNVLLILTRKACRLESYITPYHFDKMNLVMLVTSCIIGVAYLSELFMAWYSGNPAEQYAFLNRIAGPYAWDYWIMISCNVIIPQVLWSKKIRYNLWATFAISILINVGMWFERFVIIVTSLHRDNLPSSWTMFSPTYVDIGIFLGTIGFFFALFLLYARTFPLIAQAELKTVLKTSAESFAVADPQNSTTDEH